MSYAGFKTVQLRKPQRSMFNLSHERKLSTRMGKLVPIFISETIPNDTFKVSSEVLMRLAPILAPIMHIINVYVHYFFVPNRLLWKDWETFITGGRLGEAVDSAPVPPYSEIGIVLDEGQQLLNSGSLADYLGVPAIPDADQGSYPDQRIAIMPFAAYFKVYQDYYRDRNYEADTTLLPLASGNQANFEEFMRLRTRKWEHDYFTSALPWTQRGSEVLMPLMGSGIVNYMDQTLLRQTAGTGIGAGEGLQALSAMTVGTTSEIRTSGAASKTVNVENIESVEIDASSVSINDLRRAVRLQEWLERNALAGSRYTESIMAHFARRSSDARLQRAEYLGGGKVPVKISEVMTTAYSEDASLNTVPPGNPAGRAVSYGRSNHFSYNCEEHGFVIGIMSVMPKSAYMQGMPRMFTQRNTFLDYPWPAFAHLGEQEVFKYEIFANATNLSLTDPPVFGYQSRYADWKWMNSTVHGDFRTSLDFWHLARKFSTSPVLGETFVTFEDTLQDRIFAVSEVDTLWCMIYNKVKVVRSLPYFGTPML